MHRLASILLQMEPLNPDSDRLERIAVRIYRQDFYLALTHNGMLELADLVALWQIANKD